MVQLGDERYLTLESLNRDGGGEGRVENLDDDPAPEGNVVGDEHAGHSATTILRQELSRGSTNVTAFHWTLPSGTRCAACAAGPEWEGRWSTRTSTTASSAARTSTIRRRWRGTTRRSTSRTPRGWSDPASRTIAIWTRKINSGRKRTSTGDELRRLATAASYGGCDGDLQRCRSPLLFAAVVRRCCSPLLFAAVVRRRCCLQRFTGSNLTTGVGAPCR